MVIAKKCPPPKKYIVTQKIHTHIVDPQILLTPIWREKKYDLHNILAPNFFCPPLNFCLPLTNVELKEYLAII